MHPDRRPPTRNIPADAASNPNMRRTRPPLFAITIFAVALILFAASFGRWRVYSSEDLPGRGWSMDPKWAVDVTGGRVIASRHHLLSSFISHPAPPGWRNLGGFSYEQRRFFALSGAVKVGAQPSSGSGGAVGGQVMAEHLAVPTYPLPLIGGLLLAWRIHRIRRASMPGCCANCGYDLRATPDRCPECGMAIGSA